MAAIWSEVLGGRRVGIHDDFVQLGGHSLLATQVMSRVREAFGVEVPLRRLFEGPTVAELARAVETALAAGAPAPDGPIPRAPRTLRAPADTALPLSFAQERLWFLDRLEPGQTLYNLPLVLRLAGELDAAALAAAFGEIARRHEALRTVFAERDGEPVQRVLPAGPWELPAADLSGLPAAARAGGEPRGVRACVEVRRAAQAPPVLRGRRAGCVTAPSVGREPGDGAEGVLARLGLDHPCGAGRSGPDAHDAYRGLKFTESCP